MYVFAGRGESVLVEPHPVVLQTYKGDRHKYALNENHSYSNREYVTHKCFFAFYFSKVALAPRMDVWAALAET